jgi:hypothetical protein
MATVAIDIDLPPGVTLSPYQRNGDSHGFEVSWPLPDRSAWSAILSLALRPGSSSVAGHRAGLRHATHRGEVQVPLRVAGYRISRGRSRILSA